MDMKNFPYFRALPKAQVNKSWLLGVAILLSACTSLDPSVAETTTGQAGQATHQTQYRGGDYQIGPEDVLDISVWREETLQRKVVVRPDGGISFPLAGDLQAAGKTAAQLETEISQRLKKYIPEPVVTVAVDQVAGYRIYVLGKVNKPGQFVVGRYVDVLQALTLAEGLTPYASENNIRIVRRENNTETVFPFSYSAVKNGQDLSQNIMLKSNDVVIVP
jgi:polysaccharide export outer membrane protein